MRVHQGRLNKASYSLVYKFMQDVLFVDTTCNQSLEVFASKYAVSLSNVEMFGKYLVVFAGVFPFCSPFALRYTFPTSCVLIKGPLCKMYSPTSYNAL